jgi:hypothetical protein
MKSNRQASMNALLRSSERGVGLLIAMSVMVVVLAIGAMLMFLASSESSSVGRQRVSTSLTYAAQAGLEEARSRLLTYNPQSFTNSGAPLPALLNQVVYIVNPAAGETVNPTDLSSTNAYADNEYQSEFGVPVTAATVAPFVPSIQSNLTAAPPIAFKWVRVTLKTEQSGHVDINRDSGYDSTTPIYYDGKRQNLTHSGGPVYTLTAFAAVPFGRPRILQLEVMGAPGGFDYAIAANNDCQLTAAGATYNVSGNVYCGNQMQLNGAFTLAKGNLDSNGKISGTGSIGMTGSGQQVDASQINVQVTGGATGSSMPPPTVPVPDVTTIGPTVIASSPLGTCVNGNPVIDLGNTTPPQVLQFTGGSITTACGTTLNPMNIPANVTFTGQGTLWFSGMTSGTVTFNNNFGTATQPLNINIVCFPATPNPSANVELEFRGQVTNITGLLYSQGHVENEGPTGQGQSSSSGNSACGTYLFNVSGSIIAGGTGTGNNGAGTFETEHCSTVSVTYNPTAFSTNPPPGFNGVWSQGLASTAVLNWHDVQY